MNRSYNQALMEEMPPRGPSAPIHDEFEIRSIRKDPPIGVNMSYHYVHDVPGRLRVKIPFIKGNPAVARETEEIVKAMPGINSANANPVTGSIIVQYHSGGSSACEILDTLKRNGYFDPAKAKTSEQYIEEKCLMISQKMGKSFGKAMVGLAIERTFSGTPLALLTVLI
jgi:hypothetical protein